MEVCIVFSGEANWISAVSHYISKACLNQNASVFLSKLCMCVECPAYFIQLWWNRTVEQLSLRRDNEHICYLLIPWLCLYLQDRTWIKEVFLVHYCREEKVALQEPQSYSQCKECIEIRLLFSNLSVAGLVRPAVTASKMTARYGDSVFAVPQLWNGGLICRANHLIKIYFFICCSSAFSELGESAGDPRMKPGDRAKTQQTHQGMSLLMNTCQFIVML